FGIKTRDIVLYPFGGVASIMGEPKPFAELIITIAGPLVNVVIAALLYPFASIPAEWSTAQLDFVTQLFAANVALVVFNSIPAFPMDGGRIFRSLMALAGVKSATIIAARVSQALSLGLGALAVYSGNVILIIIASLVFMNALQEIMRERTKRASIGFSVRDVMTDITNLQVFPHATTISHALGVALRSLQSSFPVVLGDNLMGVVEKRSLIDAAARDEENAYVANLMSREFATVSISDSLEHVSDLFSLTGADTVLVMDSGSLVGMIFKDKFIEFLIVNGLRDRARAASDYLDEEI
ncbi:MAG: hypothetical protein DCC75_06620, partial [Proteobacteria bacterium]